QAPMPVPQPEAQRQGDDEGDAERGERELRGLPRLVQQKTRVIGDEAERVDEERGDDHRNRLQGVRMRWRSASSRSAVRASRIARPPPARSSVRKMSG